MCQPHRAALLALGGKCLITADHGNCEQMRNADGSPNTAHTTNLVHFIYVADDAKRFRVEDGILADVAPTLLFLLGLPQPREMTGRNLLVPVSGRLKRTLPLRLDQIEADLELSIQVARPGTGDALQKPQATFC